MMNEFAAISTVPPSGAARETYSAPTIEAAPGRFSTTVVTPAVRPTCSASTRTRRSAPPPGGNGTMSLIVFGTATGPGVPAGRRLAPENRRAGGRHDGLKGDGARKDCVRNDGE